MRIDHLLKKTWYWLLFCFSSFLFILTSGYSYLGSASFTIILDGKGKEILWPDQKLLPWGRHILSYGRLYADKATRSFRECTIIACFGLSVRFSSSGCDNRRTPEQLLEGTVISESCKFNSLKPTTQFCAFFRGKYKVVFSESTRIPSWVITFFDRPCKKKIKKSQIIASLKWLSLQKDKKKWKHCSTSWRLWEEQFLKLGIWKYS